MHIHFNKFPTLDNVFPHTLRNISNWLCLKLTEVKRHIFYRHKFLMVLFIWTVLSLVWPIHSLLTSSHIGWKQIGKIFYTRSFGGPPGPNFWSAALRVSLTSSFAPFGRLGRVTHAPLHHTRTHRTWVLPEPKFENKCTSFFDFFGFERPLLRYL